MFSSKYLKDNPTLARQMGYKETTDMGSDDVDGGESGGGKRGSSGGSPGGEGGEGGGQSTIQGKVNNAQIFEKGELLNSQTPGFVVSGMFSGARKGYVFKTGTMGTGYYTDHILAAEQSVKNLEDFAGVAAGVATGVATGVAYQNAALGRRHRGGGGGVTVASHAWAAWIPPAEGAERSRGV